MINAIWKVNVMLVICLFVSTSYASKNKTSVVKSKECLNDKSKCLEISKVIVTDDMSAIDEDSVENEMSAVDEDSTDNDNVEYSDDNTLNGEVRDEDTDNNVNILESSKEESSDTKVEKDKKIIKKKNKWWQFWK